jgi:hypothetical protein
MYIVLTRTAYLFVACFIGLAAEEYKIGFGIRKFIRSKWPKIKETLVEAFSYPYKPFF